ncbi:MAG: response regulator, partial [Acidobacteriota bacterium]
MSRQTAARSPAMAPPPAVGARRRARAVRIGVILAVQPSLWCELLARALSVESDLEVTACAESEEELRRILPPGTPGIAIVDYEAMGPNTEGLVARLRRAAPQVRVVVLARRSGDETVAAVLRAGASGLVSKQAPLRTL